MCTNNPTAPVGLVRAGLDALLAADVAVMADEAVRSELLTLLGASNQLAAVVSARVAAFDARGLAVGDGFRTAKGWLRAFGRRSGAAAAGLVRSARVLRELPALAAAAGRGEASAEHVAKVAVLADQVGVAAVREVDMVVAVAACRVDPAGLAGLCERIRAHVDPDGPEPDADFERRSVTMSRLHGMVVLRGQLDPEGGATLITALDALMTPPGPTDERSMGQRRADALVQLARGALAEDRLPTVGGHRPQVGVLLTPQTLLYADDRADPHTRLLRQLDHPTDVPAGHPSDSREPRTGDDPEDGDARGGGAEDDTDRADGDRVRSRPTPAGGPAASPRAAASADLGIPPTVEPAWLDWFGPVAAAVAQRLACDADIWPVVLHPATGLPLHLGRSHRLVPAWMRKALHARDRGCRWPGCDAPSPWTDGHHLTPWQHGGPTDITNLILLCRYHHGLVHEGHWRIRLDPATGEISVTRPNGRPYDLPSTRPWTTPTTRRGDTIPDAA